jgi:hypothetical protein
MSTYKFLENRTKEWIPDPDPGQNPDPDPNFALHLGKKGDGESGTYLKIRQ